MNQLEIEDIELVGEMQYDWEKLTNKTILVSGGTGFIGTFFCNVIRYRNRLYHQNIKIVSVSFTTYENDDTVTFIKNDICKPIDYESNIDYVIHMASNTHPLQYKTDPVGTITVNVFGTFNLLSLARDKNAKRFILASSVEIYGDGDGNPMKEDYCGYINCNLARSGYNESKRVSEAMCQSFYQQYGIESCVCRFARTFGADKTKKDTKAMAQFINNAVNNEDIVLRSKGLQKFSYSYIADSVSGLLCVLLNGKAGEAYNISEDNEDMTLGQYAEYIASLANKKVLYEIENDISTNTIQYALLDNEKIKKIGFKPLFSVKDALKRTFDSYLM